MKANSQAVKKRLVIELIHFITVSRPEFFFLLEIMIGLMSYVC